IWPRVQRRETLLTFATTTTTVLYAIGASRVPSHTDHQWAIVPPVSWPPFLAVGHQRAKVSLKTFVVELCKLFSVVKFFAKRVRGRGMLMQDREVELVRPPVAILRAGLLLAMVHRA